MTPKDTKKIALHRIKHPFEFLEFVDWFALPDPLRESRSQRELAKELGVGEDTVSEWKNRTGFYELVSQKRKEWAQSRTSNVIDSLYKKILRDGGATEIKLWLQFFEGWSERIEQKNPYERFHSITEEELDRKLEPFHKEWAKENGYVRRDDKS